MAKKFTINDTDREEWVNNDVDLYHMKRRSHMPMRNFVRQNRGMIDEVIRSATGQKAFERTGYLQQRGAD